MKSQYVLNENVRRLMAGLARIEERAAPEMCWMVVYGEPGLGKTCSIQFAAAQHSWLYVRACAYWSTPLNALNDILQALGVDAQRNVRDAQGLICDRLTYLAEEAARHGQSYAVALDEADHFLSHKLVVENLRDITDRTRIPLLAVCMKMDRRAIARHAQLISRVGAEVEFLPMPAADVQQMAHTLCSTPIAADVLNYVHRQCRGFARETLSALSRAEQVGERLRRPVTLQDLVGQPLFHDRETGEAHVVQPGAVALTAEPAPSQTARAS